jgi:Tat protein translocase TatB subunit
MFGTLGGQEIILILVIALIVFGPRKLPEIGKSVGRMMAEFRKASNDFRRTLEEEVEAERMRPAEPAAPLRAEPPPEPRAATVSAEAPAGTVSTDAPATVAGENTPAVVSEADEPTVPRAEAPVGRPDGRPVEPR